MKTYKVAGDYIVIPKGKDKIVILPGRQIVTAANPPHAIAKACTQLEHHHGYEVRWLYGVGAVELSTAEYLRWQGVKEML